MYSIAKAYVFVFSILCYFTGIEIIARNLKINERQSFLLMDQTCDKNDIHEHKAKTLEKRNLLQKKLMKSPVKCSVKEAARFAFT